jgi:membrane-associated phospholipid phosphatase
MLRGDWGLLILDVIGGSALGVALIIALWRLAFRQAEDENGPVASRRPTLLPNRLK